MNALPLRAPRGHPSAIVECATASRAQRAPERHSTKRSGQNVRFVRFYPPPLSITIRSGTSCLRLRRPSLPAGGQGVQRGPAQPDACTTDIVPHSCYGVRPGLSQGCIPKWGRVSGYLWGVTLGCSARYSGQPQIWDAPLSQAVFQIIGEICLTIGGFDQVDRFGLT